MPREELVIHIPRDGPMRFVYDDRLKPLMEQGEARIQRASHVEPGLTALGQDPQKWYADMTPSGGPLLGPFDMRKEALNAEVAWLNANKLGIKSREPMSCA